MKLRIRGNTLRLRLTQGEVARIADGARVEESIAFGPSPTDRLVYALVPAADAKAIGASFSDRAIEVRLPAEAARAWARGADVGVAAEQSLGEAGALRILVEKDFNCLAPRAGEDDSDAFPNPAKAD